MRAFSLVELLTALVLLTVGLAAYARAAAAVAQLENTTRLRRGVAGALMARLDSARGLSCHTARAGDASQPGIVERWSVVPDGNHLLVTDSILVAARPALSRGLSTPLPCQP